MKEFKKLVSVLQLMLRELLFRICCCNIVFDQYVNQFFFFSFTQDTVVTFVIKFTDTDQILQGISAEDTDWHLNQDTARKEETVSYTIHFAE